MTTGGLTKLLEAAQHGQRAALEALYVAVHAELHQLARAQLRREARVVTLQPTLLVNEVYLRLSGPDGPTWENRRHFFGAAAAAMRRILVDHARERLAQKRGSGVEHVSLAGAETPVDSGDSDVLDIDAALTKLAAERPRLAELVTLRFFGGLSIEEAATTLEISTATAKRDWTFARAWLKDELSAQREP
jgi:RNA polymerase sigma factor (TIGR02999 family)